MKNDIFIIQEHLKQYETGIRLTDYNCQIKKSKRTKTARMQQNERVKRILEVK